MRFTIVPSDRRVIIAGVGFTVADTGLDPAVIHAVQGYDDYIEVEYATKFDKELGRPVKPENTFHQDATLYQAAFAAWEAARQAELAARQSQEEAAAAVAAQLLARS